MRCGLTHARQARSLFYIHTNVLSKRILSTHLHVTVSMVWRGGVVARCGAPALSPPLSLRSPRVLALSFVFFFVFFFIVLYLVFFYCLRSSRRPGGDVREAVHIPHDARYRLIAHIRRKRIHTQSQDKPAICLGCLHGHTQRYVCVCMYAWLGALCRPIFPVMAKLP